MKKNKRIMVLMLSLTILIMGIPYVFATSAEDINGMSNGARMYSFSIGLSGDVIDGVVYTECDVIAPLSTTKVDILCILREENAAGGFVIVDTWRDSATGDYLLNEHEYSPAIEGGEYELSVRVGIYNSNGLVGYDYETLTGIN